MRTRDGSAWALATTMVMAVVLVAGTGFVLTSGAVGTATAQSTGIDSCTTINTSGAYRLTSDIVTGETGPCIEITASNVTLDGQGYQIRGRENTPLQQGNDGIYAGGSAGDPLVNLSIRNVTTTGWSNGTRLSHVRGSSFTNVTFRTADMNGLLLDAAVNNTLRDLTLRNNNEQNVPDLPGAGRGLTLTGNSRNNTLSNIEQTNNKYSMLLQDSSQDNRIRNVSSFNSTYVVYLYSAFDNDLRNLTSSGNDRWVLYSERNSSGNTVTNLTMDGTTVSLEPKDVAIHPVPGPDNDAPPELPNGTRGIGKYVEVTATRVDKPGRVSLSMVYADDDVREVNESSLALWRNTNGTWSRVNGSQQNVSANRVSEPNLTFPPVSEPGNRSVFGPLAAGSGSETGLGNATPTPTTTEDTSTPTPTITPVETEAPSATTQAPTTTATEQATSTSENTEPTTAASTPQTAGPGTETTATTGPGFGAVLALIAVLLVALVGARMSR